MKSVENYNINFNLIKGTLLDSEISLDKKKNSVFYEIKMICARSLLNFVRNPMLLKSKIIMTSKK